jgi:acylglycerol lipase
MTVAHLDEIHSTFPLGDEVVFLREWPVTSPKFVLVIAHGAGEHSDYWTPVARELGERFGAYGYGADFTGHGRTTGARVEVRDSQDLVAVLVGVVSRAKAAHPGLPVVLLGHSMGGLMSTRYAQQHGDTIDALVLHAAPAMPPELWGQKRIEMTLEQMTPDPRLQQVIIDDPFRSDEPIPEITGIAMHRASALAMEAAPLGSLPLIWLHGYDDRLIPLEGARLGFGSLASDRGIFLAYPSRGHGGILESSSGDMLADLGGAIEFVLAERRVV